ncbi:rab GTPase-binding effector protein 2 [Denticeps clupeoides]|uniref:Rab GTPase-binding effector protein 2 n=1 Tax=Denticeps clupeoides TaxID=299321 RepID=A0AAY4BHW0_9TELE|nr:rab GTPase-binding effector protein 2 [Denticeps clupeoides]
MENKSENPAEPADLVGSLQARLGEYEAQLEHWKGLATICELGKQEELGELQKQCDQEIESLREALRETVLQYEARLSAVQCSRTGLPAESKTSVKKGTVEGSLVPLEGTLEAGSCGHPETLDSDPGEGLTEGLEVERTGLLMEGYFSLPNDASSLSSFSLDTPSLLRHVPPQDDTASIISTGTLVPEAIYLPPAGHRLVTHADWDALHSQVAELQGEVGQLRGQRAALERELETQTTETKEQVTVLQAQVQTSEALLEELQTSFSHSQSAVQSRLTELSLSQRRLCSELTRLKGQETEGEEEDEDEGTRAVQTPISVALQGAHCEERLCIEIVNLKEQLETRTEESEVLEVQLSSLKTETERIQSQKEKVEGELQECRTELQGLRLALSHLHRDSKTLSSDKAVLHQQCLELRSQVISLCSQLDTSQAVQRDFVQLSQSLQVKLELIRQAETLDQVKEILGEGLNSEGVPPTDDT